MGDVIIEGCPLCKGNGKPYQQTHTQCFDGSLLISTGCSKCGLNILGKGDDSRQKWNSIDRPKHLEQRLAEVEERLSDAQGVFHSGQFFLAEEMLAHVQAKLFNEDYAPPANEV